MIKKRTVYAAMNCAMERTDDESSSDQNDQAKVQFGFVAQFYEYHRAFFYIITPASAATSKIINTQIK